ncbi:MAG: hypothetical protein DMF06_05085 [Verrucomicrobia bacterium]|nr:MAG: hypothetical protein DMF06_05085 [Verrucomicrobiota bacterium]
MEKMVTVKIELTESEYAYLEARAAGLSQHDARQPEAAAMAGKRGSAAKQAAAEWAASAVVWSLFGRGRNA